jgi:hypothetical protein
VDEGQSTSREEPTRLWERWVEEARQACQGDPWPGKRGEQRYRWSAPLEVLVPAASGAAQTVLATANDVSAVGIGFRCRQELPQFATVEIRVAGEAVGVAATVKQVTRTVNGFTIGAEFVVD